MRLAFAITVALCLWIVLWATGAKAIDSFLVAVVIMVLAATTALLVPHLPGSRRRR